MQPDPKINCAGAPVVTIAGREWFIPVLALRQMRLVAPALMRLLPTLSAFQGAARGAPALEANHIDALTEAVHGALTRAYPGLTRDAFLDLEASLGELIAAIPIIAKQTGLFHPIAPDAKAEEVAHEIHLGERAGAGSPISTAF